MPAQLPGRLTTRWSRPGQPEVEFGGILALAGRAAHLEAVRRTSAHREVRPTHMTLRSAFDSPFLGTISDWLEASGEVFVVIRYAYAAGAKAYLFIQSSQQLQALLRTLPPRSDVIVFRQRQLHIRGIADNALLEQATTAIPDGAWWFLLCRDGEKPSDFSSAGDNSHQALKAAIAEHQGR